MQYDHKLRSNVEQKFQKKKKKRKKDREFSLLNTFDHLKEDRKKHKELIWSAKNASDHWFS